MSIDTRSSLIRSAETLVRSKGYAGFSYADLELKIGIRKASIHYHFPTKEDLGVAVIETYISELEEQFQAIEAEFPAPLDRLSAFTKLFAESMATGALPLCGALAAEMTVLPPRMRALTTKYFLTQLHWVEKTITTGVSNAELPPVKDVEQKAYEILSLLEGASFVSWALQSKTGIDTDAIPRILGLTAN